MNNMKDPRRIFLKTLVMGVSAIIALPFLRLNSAFAELVKQTDPLVKALGYVPNVDALKGAAAPKEHKKGTKCGNCQFYADATGKAPEAKCQLIAGGNVQASGWCKSYSARAAAPKKA